MTLSNFKVVRVMGWCDLYGTSSKFFIYIRICNNWNLFIYDWKKNHLSN